MTPIIFSPLGGVARVPGVIPSVAEPSLPSDSFYGENLTCNLIFFVSEMTLNYYSKFNKCNCLSIIMLNFPICHACPGPQLR